MDPQSSVRDEWRRLGILNDKSEFVEWVHVWRMMEQPGSGYLHTEANSWFTLPWHRPFGMTELDHGAILSALQMSKGYDWPDPWPALWGWLKEGIHTDPIPSYWRIMRAPGQHHLTSYISGLRRDLRCTIEPSRVSDVNAEEQRLLIEALKPYLIIQPCNK